MSDQQAFTLTAPEQATQPVVVRETERTMLDRLRVRFGRTYKNGSYVGRQYVIAEKVATTPGGSHDAARIVDALVLDTWKPSWGELTEAERKARSWTDRVSLHGFEVKVSRSDWLTELADPTKAEAWARYCHYFWLVASERSVVRDDLPDGWGMLLPHGRSLRVAVTPRRRDPLSLPHSAVVSIARAVQKTEVAMAHRSADPSPSATETAPDQAGSTGTGNQPDGGK